MLPRRSTGGTSSPRAGPARSRQHADLDVAVRHPVAVILEADVPARVTAVVNVGREFAALDPRLPIRAPELIVNHLHTVQPVLHVIPPHHEPDPVPLARRLHDARRPGPAPAPPP